MINAYINVVLYTVIQTDQLGVKREICTIWSLTTTRESAPSRVLPLVTSSIYFKKNPKKQKTSKPAQDSWRLSKEFAARWRIFLVATNNSTLGTQIFSVCQLLQLEDSGPWQGLQGARLTIFLLTTWHISKNGRARRRENQPETPAGQNRIWPF